MDNFMGKYGRNIWDHLRNNCYPAPSCNHAMKELCSGLMMNNGMMTTMEKEEKEREKVSTLIRKP